MMAVCESVEGLSMLSLRGKSGARTRQSIVSRGRRTSLSLRLLVHSGSPRAFSPRDDKVGSDGSVDGWRTNSHVVIARRERSERTRQSTRVPGEADGLSLRLLVHSGSPRASPSR